MNNNLINNSTNNRTNNLTNHSSNNLMLAENLAIQLLVDVPEQDVDRDQMVQLLKLLINKAMNGEDSLALDEVVQLSAVSMGQLESIINSHPKIFEVVEVMQPENYLTINEDIFKPDIAEVSPAVYYQQRLFLQRYWVARMVVYSQVEQIMSYPESPELPDLPNLVDLDSSQQQIFQELKHNHIVQITGGAGTGKSTTALRLISAINQQADFLTVLCAPTGKAVSRLAEGIKQQFADADGSGQSNRICHCLTIHNLLKKAVQGKPHFNREDLLFYQLYVIDEVAMLEWELFAELMEAIPINSYILLLGDPFQLSSIGVGGVLNNLIQRYPQTHVELHKQHRFTDTSEIYQLANLAKQGQLLSSELPLPHRLTANAQEMIETLTQWVDRYLVPLYPLQGQQDYIELMERVILSPWRYDRHGVQTLNQLVQQRLYHHQVISQETMLCEGMVVINRYNYPHRGIYNGDRAVVISTEQAGLQAVFVNRDKTLPLEQLSHIEPAYAMTVHQTQGSEFDNVLVWLGQVSEKQRSWLTPPLLYTSISRAKKQIQICGDVG